MNIAKYIDHTLLKADVKEEEIEKICREALEYNFKAVCINPAWVETASQMLEGSQVAVCTVFGFPLGANTTEVKVYEAQDAVKKGASEIDIVINISKAKDGAWDVVQKELEDVIKSVDESIITKVIIETSLLSDEEKIKASKIVEAAGADFVKTSTGFSTGGATVEDVKLMREAIGPNMGIKASGGVSNRTEAIKMIEAGATRIGASKGIQIVSGE